MANPQKENGYTPIANEILDHIIRSGLNGTELSIVLLIIRKTYGYNKKQDGISLSQFLGYLPICKQTLCTSLKTLQLVKIIRLVQKGSSFKSFNIYELNKDYESWQLVKKTRLVQKTRPTSLENATQLVQKPRHTKDNNTKDNIQKKKDIITLIFENVVRKDLVTHYIYKKEYREEDMNKRDYARINKTLTTIGKERTVDGALIKHAIDWLSQEAKEKKYDWTIETVNKKWNDFIKHENKRCDRDWDTEFRRAVGDQEKTGKLIKERKQAMDTSKAGKL